MAKRGRKAGAAGCSFLGVNLRELNRVLKEDAIVMVSRKYAEQLHLEGSPIISEANNKHIEAYTNSIDSNEVDLDKEYPNGPITQGDKKLMKMVEEVEEKEVDLDF